jgi:hypothetical protein
MSGGKSGSQSSTSSATTSTSSTATGVAGDVYQGGSLVINQDVPDAVTEVVKQLVGLSEKSINAAVSAGQAALDINARVTQTAAQPDVTLAQDRDKNMLYIVGIIAAAGVVIWGFRK